jgi:hypothetical protein
MVKCITEMNNGLGIGNADPVEQCQHDYVLICTSPFGAHFGGLCMLRLLTKYISNSTPSELLHAYFHSCDRWSASEYRGGDLPRQGGFCHACGLQQPHAGDAIRSD